MRLIPLPAHDGIDLWRVRVSAVGVGKLWPLLQDEEHARAGRFTFDRDRQQFVFARGLLRQILASYLDVAPNTIGFTYGVQGKPVLHRTLESPDLRFNVSHSGDLVLIACAIGRDVGVDVEAHGARVDMSELARSSFSAAECHRFLATDDAQREALFFRYWTAKEAYIKLLGGGLSIPLQQFTVDLSLETAMWPVITDDRHVPFSMVAGVRMPDGFAGAVAATGRDWRVNLMDLEMYPVLA